MFGITLAVWSWSGLILAFFSSSFLAPLVCVITGEWAFGKFICLIISSHDGSKLLLP